MRYVRSKTAMISTLCQNRRAKREGPVRWKKGVAVACSLVLFPVSLFAESSGTKLGILTTNPGVSMADAVASIGQVTFRDCPDACPEMVVVPQGSFAMGSPAKKREALNSELGEFFANEGPRKVVTIAKPFAVGVFEVTWAQWGECVAEGACNGAAPEATGGDNGWGKGKHPVIEVSWHHAKTYTAWLSEKTGYKYRLLTEAEWEYAARAKSQTNFSWGEKVDRAKANCNGCGSKWDNHQTAEVGEFPPNDFGIYDMHGNVAEWVEDCWEDSYESLPSDGSARTKDKCLLRVVRGGAWNLRPMYLRSAARDCYHPGDQLNTVGFRVARTISTEND